MSAAALAAVDYWPELIWACRVTWRNLPAIVVVSLGWLLTAVPLVLATLVAPRALVMLAALPVALSTTALVRSLAPAAGCGSVGLTGRPSIDMTLGSLCWAWASGIVWLSTLGDFGIVAASMLGASGCLVLPVALCYGAVRDRRGFAALRGGVIIAIVRPGVAVSIAAGVVVATFASIASAGALAVVVPPLVCIFGCGTVRTLVRAA